MKKKLILTTTSLIAVAPAAIVVSCTNKKNFNVSQADIEKDKAITEKIAQLYWVYEGNIAQAGLTVSNTDYQTLKNNILSNQYTEENKRKVNEAIQKHQEQYVAFSTNIAEINQKRGEYLNNRWLDKDERIKTISKNLQTVVTKIKNLANVTNNKNLIERSIESFNGLIENYFGDGIFEFVLRLVVENEEGFKKYNEIVANLEKITTVAANIDIKKETIEQISDKFQKMTEKIKEKNGVYKVAKDEKLDKQLNQISEKIIQITKKIDMHENAGFKLENHKDILDKSILYGLTAAKMLAANDANFKIVTDSIVKLLDIADKVFEKAKLKDLFWQILLFFTWGNVGNANSWNHGEQILELVKLLPNKNVETWKTKISGKSNFELYKYSLEISNLIHADITNMLKNHSEIKLGKIDVKSAIDFYLQTYQLSLATYIDSFEKYKEKVINLKAFINESLILEKEYKTKSVGLNEEQQDALANQLLEKLKKY
ncbi:hypothetical protein [Mycoplasmopsis opalescens]|uniref:hypothetical protein n=1 Tax=Mycoplasmopsis opalescens TaxID=114886 RepID=UPI0004A78594|nr:hypothetical protein [Mycoplasmopsis opalescens]